MIGEPGRQRPWMWKVGTHGTLTETGRRRRLVLLLLGGGRLELPGAGRRRRIGRVATACETCSDLPLGRRAGDQQARNCVALVAVAPDLAVSTRSDLLFL